MRSLFALTVLLLLVPASGRAQEVPEQLLSAKTQLYLRWDGITAHQAKFNQTGLGKMLQGDTGHFVSQLFQQLQEGVSVLLTVERLLSGDAPEKLQQMQADAAEAAKLIPLLTDKGFILTAELTRLEPPEGQVTLVLPGAGAKPAPLFSALRLTVNLLKGKVKESKIGDRTIHQVELPGLALAWWVEGPHALVRFSTSSVENLLKRPGDKNLTSHPLYQQIRDFKTFPTSARAFLDVNSLVKLAATRSPAMKKAVEDLGLEGLKSLTFYSGFAGVAERGLVELDMPGPRKGLLSMFKGRAFTLADVPALPPDVVAFSMTTFDAAGLYDLSLQAIEVVLKAIEADGSILAGVREGIEGLNRTLGLDLRKDLLGSLDDRLVQYLAPSEGPLNFGQVVMFKIKDPAKLKTALEQLIKGVSKASGADVQVKKRTYRGVEMREVRVRAQGFIFVPTYAIHKDWLVISLFPQPLQGYVLRATGELAAWKPSVKVKEQLEQLPREFQSISYTDPRPTIRELLSIAPLIAGAVVSFNPETSFEPSTIPNAQEANRHLFPNVTVSTDDGTRVRLESRASLPLPIHLTGIDSYGLFLVLGFSFARIG